MDICTPTEFGLSFEIIDGVPHLRVTGSVQVADIVDVPVSVPVPLSKEQLEGWLNLLKRSNEQ